MNQLFFQPTVPLGRQAHVLARKFAQEQATPQQSKQVYLNTLAVYAVHTHLKRLHIFSDLKGSASWNPGCRALFQPADLRIPGQGILECCPLLPGETQMRLTDSINDRSDKCLGHAAVKFGDCLDAVELAGFIAAAEILPEQVTWPMAKLYPFEQFLTMLLTEQPAPYPTLVKLEEWFQLDLSPGWQTLEALLKMETVPFAGGVRGGGAIAEGHRVSANHCVSGCKVLDFAQLGARPSDAFTKSVDPTSLRLVLLLNISRMAKTSEIIVRLCSMNNHLHLPTDLQLVVWDQEGTLIQTDTREIHNWVELEFTGQLGERFGLKVALGDVSMTEEFLI